MSRLVLAFDTATDACAIGLGVWSGDAIAPLASRDFCARRAAMSGLLPAVRDMLRDADVSLQDVAEVVVGRGPGSFTGVRIGVATAKGVAHALGVPLYGVGTLDAIAWQIAAEPCTGLIGVVGDAMRGEVYPALFDVGRDGRGEMQVARCTPDFVARPEAAAERWVAEAEVPILLAGNGLAKYVDVFVGALGEKAGVLPERLWAPVGTGLLAAYRDDVMSGRAGDGDPSGVLPVYTRLSDAEEAERARHGSGPQALPATGVGGPP